MKKVTEKQLRSALVLFEMNEDAIEELVGFLKHMQTLADGQMICRVDGLGPGDEGSFVQVLTGDSKGARGTLMALVLPDKDDSYRGAPLLCLNNMILHLRSWDKLVVTGRV